MAVDDGLDLAIALGRYDGRDASGLQVGKDGAVSRKRNRLHFGAMSPNPAGLQAMTDRHSASAAERLSR